jgi:hypothetical protein
MTTTATITAASFPTPDLAKRTADPGGLWRVAAFAERQADAAEALRVRLAATWPGMTGRDERMSALWTAHAESVAWRYEFAVQAGRRLGQGIPFDATRFITPLRDGGPNADRLGYLGRLRDGADWDPASRTYQGGDSTPAHEVMLAYGQAALDRMSRETPNDEVLLNTVRVGARGRLVPGNRLVRGAAARRIADNLVARVAARGGDTSRMEVGGDPLYVVTADPDHADALFDIALTLLAAAPDLNGLERLRAWQDARYLLYQAPRMKKGSDAVTRVFLVAVGAVLFGRAPVLQQDVDLRCMVLGQAAATEMYGDTSLIAG